MNHWVHDLNPILLSMGPLTVRWYGFMYLVGFVLGLVFMVRRHKKGLFKLDSEESQVLISYLMIGMMIFARLTYVIVYNPAYYWAHPTEIPAIWMGGLSFHGAAIGFVLAMIYYSRHNKVGFFHLSDVVCMGAAQGIFWGRIGNFINGELYGRVTDVPWGIIFPAGGNQPRHPSQLYQGLLEGLSVFCILLLIDRRERRLGFGPQPGQKPKKGAVMWKRSGVVSGSFLIAYGVARFIVEFFREPDSQLGYFFGFVTMGQILCFLMIVIGAFLIRYLIRHPKPEYYN